MPLIPTRYRPPAADDGLGWAVAIQRHVEPKAWRDALAEVPEDRRPIAEEYLRGIAARMRNARALKAQREAVGVRRR